MEMCPQFGINTLKNYENVIQRYKNQFKRSVTLKLQVLFYIFTKKFCTQHTEPSIVNWLLLIRFIC